MFQSAVQWQNVEVSGGRGWWGGVGTPGCKGTPAEPPGALSTPPGNGILRFQPSIAIEASCSRTRTLGTSKWFDASQFSQAWVLVKINGIYCKQNKK